jgi:hypothetical protein
MTDASVTAYKAVFNNAVHHRVALSLALTWLVYRLRRSTAFLSSEFGGL